MRLPISTSSIFRGRYRYYVTFFIAGAGLEMFMNLFHVGEANIYRSINKSLSTSRAESQFEQERQLYEKIESSEDGN